MQAFCSLVEKSKLKSSTTKLPIFFTAKLLWNTFLCEMSRFSSFFSLLFIGNKTRRKNIICNFHIAKHLKLWVLSDVMRATFFFHFHKMQISSHFFYSAHRREKLWKRNEIALGPSWCIKLLSLLLLSRSNNIFS